MYPHPYDSYLRQFLFNVYIVDTKLSSVLTRDQSGRWARVAVVLCNPLLLTLVNDAFRCISAVLCYSARTWYREPAAFCPVPSAVYFVDTKAWGAVGNPTAQLAATSEG